MKHNFLITLSANHGFCKTICRSPLTLSLFMICLAWCTNGLLWQEAGDMLIWPNSKNFWDQWKESNSCCYSERVSVRFRQPVSLTMLVKAVDEFDSSWKVRSRGCPCYHGGYVVSSDCNARLGRIQLKFFISQSTYKPSSKS